MCGCIIDVNGVAHVVRKPISLQVVLFFVEIVGDLGMRMWMVPTSCLCRKHLLGEHVEIHMFIGAINNIKVLDGYINSKLLFPSEIEFRHNQLVEEMENRGYKHNSPLPEIEAKSYYEWLLRHRPTFDAKKDVKMNLNILWHRCLECRERINYYKERKK